MLAYLVSLRSRLLLYCVNKVDVKSILFLCPCTRPVHKLNQQTAFIAMKVVFLVLASALALYNPSIEHPTMKVSMHTLRVLCPHSPGGVPEEGPIDPRNPIFL